MKKVSGIVFVVVGAFLLGNLFFHWFDIPGAKEALSKQADGDFFAANPTKIWVLGGAIALWIGGWLLKK